MSGVPSAVPSASVYRICIDGWVPNRAVDLEGFGGEAAIQGIDARRIDVPAVIGLARALGFNVELDLIHRRERYWPSATQLACALGHRLAYRSMIEQGVPYAIVLEEDAQLSGALLETQALISVLACRQPRIVQLSCRGEVYPKHSRTETCPMNIVPLRYPPRQTTAYAINASAARLGVSTPMDGLADWPGFATLVDFWAHVPWPFTEVDTGSTITMGSQGPGSERSRPLARQTRARWDHLFRSTLPRIESKLWRSRGRPRLGTSGELWAPTIPAPVINSIRALARNEVRGLYSATDSLPAQ